MLLELTLFASENPDFFVWRHSSQPLHYTYVICITYPVPLTLILGRFLPLSIRLIQSLVFWFFFNLPLVPSLYFLLCVSPIFSIALFSHQFIALRFSSSTFHLASLPSSSDSFSLSISSSRSISSSLSCIPVSQHVVWQQTWLVYHIAKDYPQPFASRCSFRFQFGLEQPRRKYSSTQEDMVLLGPFHNRISVNKTK